MKTSALAGHTIEVLDKINNTTIPADLAIAEFYKQRKYLGSHDRRWITEKLYSIIRNYIFIRELSKNCLSFDRENAAFSMFMIHEIEFSGIDTERIKSDYSQLLDSYKAAGYEINIESVVDCVRKTAAKFASDPTKHLLIHSFPDFFCTSLPLVVRDKCTSIMKGLNHEAKVCIRVDLARISREEVVNFFGNYGVEAFPSEYSPLGVYLSKRVNINVIELYKNGLIEIQDEASQLVGIVTQPREGEVIVDACAGAGGKSLELAALSEGKSDIIALDVDADRLKNLRVRIARSGYRNIEILKVRHPDFVGIEHLLGVADKVLVDAPCSGSGTIRRNPDKKFRLTADSISKAAAYQKELLKHYTKLVKPGGRVVYSTCSIFEEENQSVVNYFLESNSDFKKIDISEILVDPRFSGFIEDGFLTIYPFGDEKGGNCHEMDGFFVAVLERRK
jgi:16S rRNA (cytosine967-C5)-methyltransferase